jgi:hypothetical protein
VEDIVLVLENKLASMFFSLVKWAIFYEAGGIVAIVVRSDP